MMVKSFLEMPVEVEFDFHRGCPEKRWGENVHPEEPAEIEIRSVKYKSEYIDTDTIDKRVMAQIEKEIWDQLAADEEAADEDRLDHTSHDPGW